MHRAFANASPRHSMHSQDSRTRELVNKPLSGSKAKTCPFSRVNSPKGQYSRPGPKSGMGRLLISTLLMLKGQLSHGVRVPTLSVGVGEGSPQAQTGSHCMPKTNGIQVIYGKQDPTHEWNRYIKRSFRRACNRAVKNGHASYRGKLLTVRQAPEPQLLKSLKPTPSPYGRQRRLQVFCYNVGGLGSGMYEDLMGFLDQSQYDIALVQETKLRVDSEYVTPNWICVGSGTESQQHAGVLILIRKSLTNVREVRHDTIIPGRLLRVRFPLGNDGCKLSVVCAYQHAWNPKDSNILAKREEFWHKLSQCVGSIPYREHLVLGGDLNVQLTPMHPHVGHGTGALSAERAPDADAVRAIMSTHTHTLVALNTWGQQGCKAHTFVFGKRQAQLDYVIVRQRHADALARRARPIHDCPVGGWRQGGGMRKPIVATLPFHRKIFHKPPAPAPCIDAEKIVQIAQHGGAETQVQLEQFRRDIAEKIASVKTMHEVGNISMLVSEVARKHFPKIQERTTTTARWQQIEVKQGIKDMWKAWRSYKRDTGVTVQVTLEQTFGRWKTWSSYHKLYRQHKERWRTTKKAYILEQMSVAEKAARDHNQRLLYQVVRSLAPKSRRGRPQLRDSGGQMMTRSEEATCFHEHFATKFTASDEVEAAMQLDRCDNHHHLQDGPSSQDPLLSPQVLENHLNHAPLRKAVHPPSSTWRLCSDIVAEKVCQIMEQQWTDTSKTIPQNWSDAHLVLIRKPAKSGKEAGRYRPIGLQDELGKLTFKALLEPHREIIFASVTRYPQYGHTPSRSHRDALRRVFDHCASVRAQCKAQHSTLHEKHEGVTGKQLMGGIQITLDLAAAFNTMPRRRLLEGMQRMELPHFLIQIVMNWHYNANYHINHDGTDRIIRASQGVRQGCAVAPLLWLIFSHLVSEKLAEKIGYQAAVDLLNIFADDYHCSAIFHSVWEVEQTLSRINILLSTLKEMGMLVSPSKSKAILKCAGPGAETLRRKFTKKTHEGNVLRIRSAGGCVDIPLVDSFTYLGAIVSYDHFEDRTLTYRLEVGSGTFGRLSRVLRGRHALTRIRNHKLRIWQACVYTATVYSLDACGLTPLGVKKLTNQLMRQIRLIVRDPVYMTGKPHQTILEEWGLLSPLAALRRQLDNEPPEDPLQQDAVKRGPNSISWQRVMTTLVDLPTSSLVEIPDHTNNGVPCPECGVYFANRTSMLCHMSKRHQHHESRPVNQPSRPFDKHRDAKDGVPQCSHCNVRLCDFSSLRKHINERRCKVLFPIHPAQHTQTQALFNATNSMHNDHMHNPSQTNETNITKDPEEPHPQPEPPGFNRPGTSTPTPMVPIPAQTYSSDSANAHQPMPPDSGREQMPAEEYQPYFCRTHVRDLLEKHSENAAFHLQDRKWLRQHCALCSQWIACHTKVKQHYRLSHPTEFELFAEDARHSCTKFNTPASPCDHCGAAVKAYRQHPSKCPTLWQICLMSLKFRHDRSSHGAATGDVRAAGRGAAWSNGMGARQKGSRNRDGPSGQEQSPANGTGQGTPRITGPSNRPPWRRAGGKGRHADGPHQTQMIKALARLALQQETALKILRQDYSWVLFVQPGNQGPLPLLYAAAQKWKKAQEDNSTKTTLRTALFGCLIQMLDTGLKDIGSEGSAPLQKKAEEMKWLKDGLWSYQKWSPALGSLVADETKAPIQHTKLMEALTGVLPLLMQPHMIHRFHATRPLTGNMTGITTFQLDISNRTTGHQLVWECLEAMTGLTALQAIGLQLRRDTLKQSPAAALVQQALAESS